MNDFWLLVLILVVLVLLFGGGIIYQLVNALFGIIVLLILIGIVIYIWRRV
jgi:hypothetical protein